MKRQKFKPGDRVRWCKTGAIGKVVEAKYRPAVAAVALVRGREVSDHIIRTYAKKPGFYEKSWFGKLEIYEETGFLTLSA